MENIKQKIAKAVECQTNNFVLLRNILPDEMIRIARRVISIPIRSQTMIITEIQNVNEL
jgi:hypothetical protein